MHLRNNVKHYLVREVRENEGSSRRSAQNDLECCYWTRCVISICEAVYGVPLF